MKKLTKKLAAFGAAGVLSLAMGTTVFAAGSVGRYASAMIGHHRNHIGYIDSMIYAKNYCDNYILSGDVLKSVQTCVSGYPAECALADRVCQNSGVCVQGCPGGYVDGDGNGICDNCEAAGYHGYCDNYVDANGDGVCDNLHNGGYCGNVNGNGGDSNYGGNGNGDGSNYGGGNGNGNGSGNGYGYGSGNGNGNGNGYGGGNGGHHSGGHGRGCR